MLLKHILFYFILFYLNLFKFEAKVRPLPGPILKLSPWFSDWKSKRRSDLVDEFCRLDIRTDSSIPKGRIQQKIRNCKKYTLTLSVFFYKKDNVKLIYLTKSAWNFQAKPSTSTTLTHLSR